MKLVILALLTLSCVQCTVPVAAQQPTPKDIEAACIEQGGCIRVSKQWLEETIMYFVLKALLLSEEEHAAKAAVQCRKGTKV